MHPLRYALVAYVKAPLGEFVEKLRRELRPQLPHLPAHLSILPPRLLQVSEEEARTWLEEVCRTATPFEVVLGEVETFVPVTPTVFLRVAQAAYRMRELHDLLNTNGLRSEEPWPYMPHLTIVKMGGPEEAQAAFRIAQEDWSKYQGTRRARIEQLTFVREAVGETWEDLAPMPLGGSLALKQGR
jgi:2'-5' RNA ligase